MEPAAPTLPATAPPPPEAALVLERPAPPTARTVMGLLVVGSFLVPPGAAALALRLSGVGPGPGGVPAWLAGPFGPWPAVGSALFLLGLGLVMDKLWLGCARRRYGRCTLDGEELTFELCLGGQEERVPLAEVTAFRAAPAGLLVEITGRGALERWTRPLLIPTRDEAELAQAVARLEAPRECAPGAASFGQRRPGWVWLVLAPAVLGLLYGLLGLVAWRHGIEPAALLALPLLTAVIAGLWLLEARVLGPRWTPVHLGRRALLAGRERIEWDYVERAGVTADGELALEAGPRRVRARVAPRADEARALLARRLQDAGLDPVRALPAWAKQPAVARRRRTLLAVWGVPALVCLLVAGSDLPIHDALSVSDDDGVRLRLIFRRCDGQPRLITIVASDDGFFPRLQVPELLGALVVKQGSFPFDDAPRGEVDLIGGRLVTPDGREDPLDPHTRLCLFDGADAFASEVVLPPALTERLRAAEAARPGPVESIPALLDDLPLPADPLLRDWLEGRRGRRTFEVRDARGWRLVWGAERGRVLFCALVAPGAGVQLTLFGCAHRVAGPVEPTVWDDDFPLVRVDATGRVLAIPGRLPGLDELLAVRAAVRDGSSLRAAHRELRELEDAP